jgi:hypothetical protein
MAKQKDPSVQGLNDLGYNVVRIPRPEIAALTLLGKNTETGKLTEFGTLDEYWTTDAKPPKWGFPVPAASVNGQKTNSLELGFGLSILKGVLGVFGASSPAIDLSHTKATGVQFIYTGVTMVSISQEGLGDYMESGTLKVSNPSTQLYITALDAELYILTDLLRATSITVSATDAGGNGVKLDLPEINGVVGGNVSVKPSDATETAVTFASDAANPVPACFGFKALALKWLPTVGAAAGVGTWSFGHAGNISFGIVAGQAGESKAPGPVVFDTGAESCLLDI